MEVPKATYPPDELLKDCKAVEREVKTNKDLAEGYVALRHALRLCNADKKALRTWRDELKKSEKEANK